MSDISLEKPSDSKLVFGFMAPVYANLDGVGETALRVATGAFLMPHGARKLFGWFGGHGLEATGQFFEQTLGYGNGYLAALGAGSVEFFGGLFLALGLLTRISAGAIVVFLLVALTVHLPNGFFWTEGGYEYPLLWAILAAYFWVRGGGALSIDRRIGREF
jgi:putative oxidoreductase